MWFPTISAVGSQETGRPKVKCFTNKAGAAYEEWALGGTGKLSTLQCVLDERALAESPEAWG